MTTEHRGTGRSYLMHRLTEERPDLAAKIATGQISAYKAAVTAGIAAPRFSLCGHDPAVLAGAMRRNLPPDVLRAVLERLALGYDLAIIPREDTP